MLPEQRRAMPAAETLIVDVAEREHPVFKSRPVGADALLRLDQRLRHCGLNCPTPQVGGHAFRIRKQEIRQRLDQRFATIARSLLDVGRRTIFRLRRPLVGTPTKQALFPDLFNALASIQTLAFWDIRHGLNHCTRPPCPASFGFVVSLFCAIIHPTKQNAKRDGGGG